MHISQHGSKTETRWKQDSESLTPELVPRSRVGPLRRENPSKALIPILNHDLSASENIALCNSRLTRCDDRRKADLGPRIRDWAEESLLMPGLHPVQDGETTAPMRD